MSFLSKRAALTVLAALSLASPRLAGAHGAPAGLDSWGNFLEAAACQRAVSRATRLCFDVATREHLGCANANLSGMPCTVDTAGMQQRTTAMIAANCSENQLRVLGFTNANGGTALQEAQLDLTKSCTQQAAAIQSLLYGPAMFSGEVASGPEARDRCLRTVSRYSFKVTRAALRERGRALDRIAAGDFTMAEKEQLLATAEARIGSVRDRALSLIRGKCTDAEFAGSYGMSFDDFSNRLMARSDCVAAASHVVNAVGCPAPVCGNAVKEGEEECDDGNQSDADACDAQCKRTSCESFGNTYDLIQNRIFENKGCTDQLCHGDAQSGLLDLRAPQSYDNLVGAASTISSLPRVSKFLSEDSFLYHKLAAATLMTTVEGSPMPNGGLPALTANELDAVRRWIYAGAPRSGVVADTATLLGGCLPPADPIQAEAPEPPPVGEGVQLHMPRVELPAQTENEVCFASYYDFSDQVPEGVETLRGTFRYKKKVETQDPLSHHLIIHAYLGAYGPEDPAWGAWTCKGGSKAGETCDPKDLTFCGSDSECGSEPVKRVACIGYGPPDYDSARTAPAFGGSQQPVAVSKWAEGVFSEIPVKGMIVWNSHFFNLTKRPAKVEAWVNFDFATPPEQKYPVQGGILDPNFKIFKMNETGGVPPFTRQEYCWQFTFPQGARLFELSSHMHKRGKLFRIWNPAGELVYTSTQYNDAVQLDYTPTIDLFSANDADRTYKYCAQYDNGFTNPAEVKRRSVSPPPPPPIPNIPCIATHCADGKVGQPCSGSGDAARNASCDTTTGAGDGRCDACALKGGFTTEDEMFLLLAYYYCSPDYPMTCKDQYGFLGTNGNAGSLATE